MQNSVAFTVKSIRRIVRTKVRSQEWPFLSLLTGKGLQNSQSFGNPNGPLIGLKGHLVFLCRTTSNDLKAMFGLLEIGLSRSWLIGLADSGAGPVERKMGFSKDLSSKLRPFIEVSPCGDDPIVCTTAPKPSHAQSSNS